MAVRKDSAERELVNSISFNESNYCTSETAGTATTTAIIILVVVVEEEEEKVVVVVVAAATTTTDADDVEASSTTVLLQLRQLLIFLFLPGRTATPALPPAMFP